MKALIEIYWNHGENSNCKVESFRFKWWKLDENGKWHRNGTIHRKWLCSNPAHPIPRAPPTQCGSPRQSSPPAIGHVNMFETSQLAQDGHSKSIKIDQNPKDSTLPSNVRMIWAMAILWIVWDLSLFRDLHKVLGGLPWPTVAYLLHEPFDNCFRFSSNFLHPGVPSGLKMDWFLSDVKMSKNAANTRSEYKAKDENDESNATCQNLWVAHGSLSGFRPSQVVQRSRPMMLRNQKGLQRLGVPIPWPPSISWVQDPQQAITYD